jgi:hypothetical protein
MASYKIIATGDYTEPFASLHKQFQGSSRDEYEKGFFYIDCYGLKNHSDCESYDLNGLIPDVSANIAILDSEESKWQKYISDYEQSENKEMFIQENNPYWDYDINLND